MTWQIQRDQIAFKYCKEELANIKLALKTTRLFLSMVVHDLRNPTTQIKYAI
jgi:predicted transport protein